MNRARPVRAWRWLALAALSVPALQACTSSGSDTPIPPPGPPIVGLGTAATTLTCDNILVVALDLTYFTPRPPYSCGTTPQCGSVLVTLLETEGGPPLASARAAAASVQFDLSAADAPSLSQIHVVKAELYGDSLLPLPIPAGGQGTALATVSLTAPTNCAGVGGATSGEAGAAGAAGATATSTGEAGAGGAISAGAGGASPEGGASGATL